MVPELLHRWTRDKKPCCVDVQDFVWAENTGNVSFILLSRTLVRRSTNESQTPQREMGMVSQKSARQSCRARTELHIRIESFGARDRI